MDPHEYCHHQNLQPPHSHSISTAHQLLSRGPIVVSTAELSLKLDSKDPNFTKKFCSKYLPIWLNSNLHFFMVYFETAQLRTKCSDMTVFPHSSTISTDMTAIIALCSFIIGMGLTATLWYIHNKTGKDMGLYYNICCLCDHNHNFLFFLIPSLEPKHRSCQRDLSHGSQSAVLGSSLSPHSACSSTNSQCAITSWDFINKVTLYEQYGVTVVLKIDFNVLGVISLLAVHLQGNHLVRKSLFVHFLCLIDTCLVPFSIRSKISSTILVAKYEIYTYTLDTVVMIFI